MKRRRLPYLHLPRRRSSRLIAAVIIAVLVLIYGLYRWELRAPASAGAASAFVVSSGQSVPTIAARLKTAGLIRNRTAFITYLNFHGLRSRLKAGSYSLSPVLSGPQVADILADGDTLTDRLVVPEGYTMAQIETLAAKHGISKTDFEAALAASHSNSFLATKPATVSLEGYLFPDSYQVSSTTTAASLVDIMLTNFGTKVGTNYDAAFAAEGLTLNQGLTLASIVEREVSRPADRPIVAQVFLKRLAVGQPLGSDVTVQYAADLLGTGFSTSLNSPYNTYAHAGLPPGPICNPGLSALDAVAHPANTTYSYFLAGNNGQTHFAYTYAQHQANIAKYLK